MAHVRSIAFKQVAERGDRVLAFSAGGAFLGGLLAQIPGAVIGAFAGAMFGWFENTATRSSENG